MLPKGTVQSTEKGTSVLRGRWERNDTAQRRGCCWVSKHKSEFLRRAGENWQKKQYREHDGGLEDGKLSQVKGRAPQGQCQGHSLWRAISKGESEATLQSWRVLSCKLRGGTEEKLQGEKVAGGPVWCTSAGWPHKTVVNE